VLEEDWKKLDLKLFVYQVHPEKEKCLELSKAKCLFLQKKMKLLITGATGLVGNELVKKSITEGHSIHYLTTRKSKLNSIQGAKGFYWNPKEGVLDQACFSEVDAIVLLAGATISKPWTKSYKEEIYSSRINATRIVFNSLKELKDQHQVKQIVSASAIGVYPSDFERTVTEFESVSADSFMSKVVIDWEKEVDRFRSLEIKISKLRIGLVLALHGGVIGTLKTPIVFGLGAAFGTGKQGQSWIHLLDVVGLFLFAVQNQWDGVYNAVAPIPVSQNQFISSLAKALKRPYFLPSIPQFLLKALIGEMSSLVLDSHYVSAQKAIDQGYTFQFDHIDRALEDLIKN
jgi:uncharacterized protein (TIGR01777 family)